MILRSSSTPLLNSLCANNNNDSNHESEPYVTASRIPRNRSVSFALCVMSTKTKSDKMVRAISDTNLKEMCSPVMKTATTTMGRVEAVCEDEAEEDVWTMMTLNRSISMDVEEECGVGDAGGGSSGGGGGVGGGGGAGGGDATDVYYQSMIQANPGNSLLLSNYAKYLNKVRGEYAKAQEYCGRALLVEPTDGEMLSLYAELVWKTEKDAPRAETYFDQAVKAAPDDCYVMASYASFLWDTEDDDEEEEVETNDVLSFTLMASSVNMWHGFQAQPPPIVTAY